jgi:hypothetical protein
LIVVSSFPEAVEFIVHFYTNPYTSNIMPIGSEAVSILEIPHVATIPQKFD